MAEKKATFTPMVEQYLQIKRENKDVMIFFRLGDFYELFFEDAVIASRELQLYLTSKSGGNGQKIDMCGVPHHAYKSYVQKLIDNGHKVGIVEQLEDPKKAQNKLVKRGVIQIITPGTNMDLQSSDNNYIASLDLYDNVAILIIADMSTGEIYAQNINNNYIDICSELMNKDVKELVVSSFISANILEMIKQNIPFITISNCNDTTTTFEMEQLFVYIKDGRQISSVARLLNYLNTTQKREIDYFKPVICKVNSSILQMDFHAKTNLELVKSLDKNKTYGTLYWFLNHTKTPMGSRLLKNTIDEPSCNQEEIESRLDSVDYFVQHYIEREEISNILSNVYDLDRLIGRINYNQTNGRDMLQLKQSLAVIPGLKSILSQVDNALIDKLVKCMSNFDNLIKVLDDAIVEDPPIVITEGGIFKKGYNQELDELLEINKSCKSWIAKLEQSEREKTGIKNLKVGYTKIFGYYIEVSSGSLSLVKPEFGYERKQTLTTGERFITKELKENEDKILHADVLSKEKEYQLFSELRAFVKTFTVDIQKLSESIAMLDMLISFAQISADNDFVRPVFNNENIIDVVNSRHVVVEACNKDKKFVPNDFKMDNNTEILLITGPNMGGKSTYMRQLALNVVMAQIGMYVSCDYYNCPVFDRIFTRIGASDDLVKGQSTFMMEMDQVNYALENATPHSLILFDEIGRGTATYDGMSLAQAILEYLASHVKAKTLFSTHYHELTTLVEDVPQIKNVHVSVKEENDEVTFLYKVKDGPMDKSYGINVAKLAHLPNSVINRAKDILVAFETLNSKKVETLKEDVNTLIQQNIEKKQTLNAKYKDILDKIKALDAMNLTPLEALNEIFELQKEINKVDE